MFNKGRKTPIEKPKAYSTMDDSIFSFTSSSVKFSQRRTDFPTALSKKGILEFNFLSISTCIVMNGSVLYREGVPILEICIPGT